MSSNAFRRRAIALAVSFTVLSLFAVPSILLRVSDGSDESRLRRALRSRYLTFGSRTWSRPSGGNKGVNKGGKKCKNKKNERNSGFNNDCEPKPSPKPSPRPPCRCPYPDERKRKRSPRNYVHNRKPAERKTSDDRISDSYDGSKRIHVLPSYHKACRNIKFICPGDRQKWPLWTCPSHGSPHSSSSKRNMTPDNRANKRGASSSKLASHESRSRARIMPRRPKRQNGQGARRKWKTVVLPPSHSRCKVQKPTPKPLQPGAPPTMKAPSPSPTPTLPPTRKAPTKPRSPTIASPTKGLLPPTRKAPTKPRSPTIASPTKVSLPSPIVSFPPTPVSNPPTGSLPIATTPPLKPYPTRNPIATDPPVTEPPTPSTTPSECQDVYIDFDTAAGGARLVGGLYVEEEWLSHGLKLSASGGFNTLPRLFNTSVIGTKEFGDEDLGSPNEKCSPPGPGIGKYGEPGMRGANCVPLGNVLIIQEDNDNTEQPDDNWRGGTINFEFVAVAKYVKELGLFDISSNKQVGAGIITISDGERVAINVNGVGNNGVQVVPIGLANVSSLKVVLYGSGAVTFIDYQFCA